MSGEERENKGRQRAGGGIEYLGFFFFFWSGFAALTAAALATGLQ